MHTLLSALQEFVLSTSGQVSPPSGIAKGLLVASLATAAAVIGTVTRADAGPCYGIPEGTAAWICWGNCNNDDCPPLEYQQKRFFHDYEPPAGTGQCNHLGDRCADACC